MELKQLNMECIRKAIQAEGSCTKASLSRLTGLSLATCNNFLNEMQESGELVIEQIESQGGRPACQYVYNKDYRHVLCVYLKVVDDVRNVVYAIANATGEIIEQDILHPNWIDFPYLLQFLRETMERDPLIDVIGISVPGNVYQGVIERCDISSLLGINMQADVTEALGVKVIVENDMNFVAYGYYCENNQINHSLVAIDFPLSDPVGAGIVIGGKIYNGYSRFAGELSYALAESGVDRAQQPASLLEKSVFLNLVAKSILMVTCVLNPNCIVLTCECIAEQDLKEVLTYCEQFVGPYHIPNVVLRHDFYQLCINGIARATLNSVQYQFQLNV